MNKWDAILALALGIDRFRLSSEVTGKILFFTIFKWTLSKAVHQNWVWYEKETH